MWAASVVGVVYRLLVMCSGDGSGDPVLSVA